MTDRKTILVTGGAGLIGSRLVARLVAEGKRVISLDNYFAGSRDNHVPGAEYREGHTKDIEKHIPETIDLIFHLGEYARVEQSILEPEIVEDLNTVGTAGVVEFWKKRRCKLVYAGSSTKFGNAGWDKTKVPYVRTKAENTELVKRVGDAEGLPYAISYFYNVYGPGERAGIYGTVIEVFREMYRKGTPIAVVSPGTQQRNFTHVDDIVDGLVLIAEKGQGDEYGLGNERSFTILEVAKLFGGEVVMLPPRAGNRMESALDTSKTRSLGWTAKRTLDAYIRDFIHAEQRGSAREKRVLVFSTTFYPIEGPAEKALLTLAEKMPDVEFDIVTTVFSEGAKHSGPALKNVNLHRVGFGNSFDKYFLPILGPFEALKLHGKHRYLFAWSLMASYAALAGMFLKRVSGLPLLITLADQNIATVSPFIRFLISIILSDADQVYGANTSQEAYAARLAGGSLRRSIGEGDAFANQLRYAYTEMLLNQSTLPS